jgi:hypothetical protein
VAVVELVNLLAVNLGKLAVLVVVAQEAILQAVRELQAKALPVELEAVAALLMAVAVEVAQALLALMVVQIMVAMAGQDYVQPLRVLLFFMLAVAQGQLITCLLLLALQAVVMVVMMFQTFLEQQD